MPGQFTQETLPLWMHDVDRRLHDAELQTHAHTTQTGPAALTLAAGMTNFHSANYGDPYAVMEGSLVHVNYMLTNSSGASKATGTLIATIPTGYRPSTGTIFVGVQSGSGVHRVDIAASGEIYYYGASLAAGEWTCASFSYLLDS